jgi:hypothetical protein
MSALPHEGRDGALFDDFLSLRTFDFSGARLVVFAGRSGSGKSTAIRFLLAAHPDFRRRESVALTRASLPRFRGAGDVIAVDDLVEPGDLVHLPRLLRGSRVLLVASHLSAAWFRPLQLFVPCVFFRTDRDGAKIRRHLARRGVAITPAALERFVAAFGATYTDAEIVAERWPAPTFDESLARFAKFCRLEVEERPAIRG